jgi:hypothetical protein
VTTAPFKKGDVVMRLDQWKVKGTVFFVRQEQADVVFHGYKRAYKKASKGDYTIGVHWEDVSNRSFQNVVLLDKWQNAKNLVPFDVHPDKEMYLRHFGGAS